MHPCASHATVTHPLRRIYSGPGVIGFCFRKAAGRSVQKTSDLGAEQATAIYTLITGTFVNAGDKRVNGRSLFCPLVRCLLYASPRQEFTQPYGHYKVIFRSKGIIFLVTLDLCDARHTFWTPIPAARWLAWQGEAGGGQGQWQVQHSG